MAIKKFHEDLPHASPRDDESWPPDHTPRFGQILAEAWQEIREAEGPKPRARATARFRHSDANGCSRLIAYASLNLPTTDEMDLAGYWVTELGTRLHEQWQVTLQKIYGPNAQVEVTLGEGHLAGHIDAIVTLRKPVYRKIAVECKSVGGFAFQLAIGARGKAEGPKQGAVVQGALNAYYANADELVIINWARDAVSVQMAKRKKLSPVGRFVAEWTIDKDTFTAIAEAEIARVNGIIELVDSGMLPARKMPELGVDKVIVRPSDGSWMQYDAEGVAINAGTFWACEYCRYQTVCKDTPAGRASIEDIPILKEMLDAQASAPAPDAAGPEDE